MSLLLQQLVVGVLVIACALFGAWRLSSVRLRLRALETIAAWPALRGASWLTRLRERTRARELQACGGCAGQPGHPTKSPQATRGAPAPNRTPGGLRR
jgi:hypothetical protein